MKIVHNGTLLTLDPANPVVQRGAVAVAAGKITALGSADELLLQYPQAETIDARGGLIMPGMLNTHTHMYSAFARGMALPGYNPSDFLEILQGLWWRLDKVLTHEDIYCSALVTGLEAIKNGTTTLLDHHASPMAAANALDELARACTQLGIRASLCYEVSDRDGPDIARAGIEENRRFAQWCKREQPELLAASFGLHASFTLSDATLRLCAEAAGDTGFHVHTAEAASDRAYSLKQWGKPVVQRLEQFGIWNPRSLAIHCVHIDEAEMDVLQDRDVSVVHNPESNMGNAVGRADVITMVKKGLRTGLGTDGYTTDMFESIKAASLLHKYGTGLPTAAGPEIPAMAFANNSAIVCRHFGKLMGRLAPGWQADLIVVDYQPYTDLSAENWFYHVLMGVSGGMVRTTMVNGRLLMQDRVLTNIDQEKIYNQARIQAKQVWERI